ncbi:succinyl-diaminopimelate desuccinylase [Consotaella salsifontis]|uniref:Succinyl-diaminopimelate desuccinylase n=1 Tax=Consotaella salsifontis TaxID=1365950 RepID=A0A1T4QJ97_9HYPH|nr:succinyl-diaminopimelate desuccinylase [Consotaella salsifontis]SKA03870.1 succinyldiaminopimelate desuccinylase [Consotaella salsifontis]
MTALPTDPRENLVRLIRCPSVTPLEAGVLSALQEMLEPLEFSVFRPVFAEPGMEDVENLFARRGGGGAHLVFAGHVDVVPPGEEAAWRLPPFGGEIRDGMLFGRGAVDMKGGIACFVAALARLLERGDMPHGQISLLISGDEEGPAVNGTPKLLQWAAERGERFDACLLGEPTSREALGDMMKVGRRGSLSAAITVTGRQGHVAYPDRADNPVTGLMRLLAALKDRPLDLGNERFQPSNLEITTFDVGNPSVNVIPERATAAFNVRFNDEWSVATLQAELTKRLEAAAQRDEIGRQRITFAIDWKAAPAQVFLTRNELLTNALAKAVEDQTGRRPEISTSGGTSDARFIKDACPVVEFGLVGQTMHMVDERVALAELEELTRIYELFITRWFGAQS